MRLLKLAVCSACLALSGLALADGLTQNFSATTGVQYYSNPLFTPANPQAVTVGTFNPTYSLASPGGSNSWNLNAGLNVQRSSDPNILINRDDPTVTAGWEHDWNTSSLALNAHYDQSSILFGNTASVSPDNVNYVHDGSRDTTSAGAKWTDNLSDSWQLESDASWSQILFNGLTAQGGNGLANLALTNYQMASLAVKLDKQVSDTLLGYGQVAYTRLLMTGTEPNSAQVNSILGMHWQTTATLALDAYAGESAISTDSTPGGYATGGLSAPATSGWIGDATLSWQGQQANASLEASRTNKPSGFGGFMSTEMLSAKAGYDWSERNSGGVEYDYLKNLDLFVSTQNRYTAWLMHKFTPTLSLQLTVQRLAMAFLANPTAYNNIAGLNLIYTMASF